MQRSPNPLEMLLTSLSEGSCSLNELDLSYCNLNGFSERIGCLPSLEELILSGNKFDCLPESIAQLSNLLHLHLSDCPSLRSLPKLPFRPERSPLLKPESSPLLKSLNWKSPTPYFWGLGNRGSIKYLQKEGPQLGLDQDFIADIYRVVNSQATLNFGSEIPEWFELQNIGAEINIKVPSHLCDELVGIASCGVICCRQPVDLVQLDCYFICNGKIIELSLITGLMPQDVSDRLFLAYFPSEESNWDIYVVNGFAKFGIRYQAHGSGVEVKECGIRLVYKKEVESFQENHNRIMAEREKKAIIHMGWAERTEEATTASFFYEGSDDCDGAGPSGEGSSNDVPHPKQIERLPELAHGDSDSEGSKRVTRKANPLFFSSLPAWMKSWMKGGSFGDLKGN
nr:tmv resistance protein n [Quercus suber]